MSDTTQSKRIRAAAVQLEAVVGNVAVNLERIEKLVDEAAAAGAKLIAIPEFCTSRIVLTRRRTKPSCRRTTRPWTCSKNWRHGINAGSAAPC